MDTDRANPLASRGLPVDPERAAAVRPLVESLLRRLQAVRDALPPGSEPPPSTLERPPT